MTRIVFPPDYGGTVPGAETAMVPFQTVGGALVPDPGVPLQAWNDPAALTVQGMFKRHPSVRKVTSFIASSVASIPLHVYERVGDTDRQRITDGPLAAVIGKPSTAPGMSWYRFWEAVIMDGLIFDRVCVQIIVDGDATELVRIPPSRWRPKKNGLGLVTGIELQVGSEWVERDPGGYLIDLGYSTGAVSVSPLESLRIPVEDYLAEYAYRRDLWEKGPRFAGIVERAQKWSSPEARSRFLSGLGQFNQVGARRGSTMLLDDDMKWKDVTGVSPKDVASTESRQYSDIEVASAFHIAPELVGAREGTFANVQAYKQSLYSMALGPYITQWELLARPLVDLLEPGRGRYIEANVAAKLRGSFEEQAAQLQTSVGAPYMTRNEARARLNMPAVPGGDELITPLNVLEGGQASPTDSAPPPKTARPRLVAAPAVKDGEPGADDHDRMDVEALLKRYWSRQALEVVPAIESGVTDWWDKARWDGELADDLLDAALALSGAVGRRAAAELGESPTAYSVARTIAYLSKVTAARAEWINDATHEQVLVAIGDEEAVPEDVFAYARDNRSVAAAGAFTAGIAAFAKTEAAKQTGNAGATKTWRVSSGNPRPAHAAMDGETVPVGELFSNGMKWPGDPSGGADEVAGCMCGLEINTP